MSEEGTNERIDEMLRKKVADAAANHDEWKKRTRIIEKKSYALADALGYARHLFYLAIMSVDDLKNAVYNCDHEFVSQKLIELSALSEPELSNARGELISCIFKGVEDKVHLIHRKMDDLQVD
jgi:hypothetical protein